MKLLWPIFFIFLCSSCGERPAIIGIWEATPPDREGLENYRISVSITIERQYYVTENYTIRSMHARRVIESEYPNEYIGNHGLFDFGTYSLDGNVLSVTGNKNQKKELIYSCSANTLIIQNSDKKFTFKRTR